MAAVMALTVATGCRSPETPDKASSYLTSRVDKKQHKGLTYFEAHPESVDKVAARRLVDLVDGPCTGSVKPFADRALMVLARSGRPEAGKLIDHLTSEPHAGRASPDALAAARRVWAKAKTERDGEEVAVSDEEEDDAPPPRKAAPKQAESTETSSKDIVRLKGGGRIVGTVVVDDKGGVTVQLPDGTLKKVPRDEVLKVEYADE